MKRTLGSAFAALLTTALFIGALCAGGAQSLPSQVTSPGLGNYYDLNAANASTTVVNFGSTSACTLRLTGSFVATVLVQTFSDPARDNLTTVGTLTSPTDFGIHGSATSYGVQAVAQSYSSGDPLVQWQCTSEVRGAQAQSTANAATGNLATNGIYNVMAYGAVGDGVTDDSAAIQAAITALKNAPTVNYSCLYFPPGYNFYYNSATPLTIPQSACVYGLGSELTGGPATTDAFQFSGVAFISGSGGQTIVLPVTEDFTDACVHLEPSAQDYRITFSTLLGCGVGIEAETNNPLGANNDNTVFGQIIHDATIGIQLLTHTAADQMQGDVFHIHAIFGSTVGIKMDTSSGTQIAPSLVDLNVFDITTMDALGGAGSIGYDEVANLRDGPEYLNVAGFFGGFASSAVDLAGGGTLFQKTVGSITGNGLYAFDSLVQAPNFTDTGALSAPCIQTNSSGTLGALTCTGTLEASCTISAATSCTATATVPAGARCTVSYDNGGTTVTKADLLQPLASVSSTTLSIYLQTSAALTGTLAADYKC